MARVAWAAELRPDRIEDYQRAHAAVWPEVLAAISAAGARNYSIHRSGTRVFGYFECDDIESTRAHMRQEQEALGWSKAMAPLFEGRPELMTEIFRLD